MAIKAAEGVHHARVLSKTMGTDGRKGMVREGVVEGLSVPRWMQTEADTGVGIS